MWTDGRLSKHVCGEGRVVSRTYIFAIISAVSLPYFGLHQAAGSIGRRITWDVSQSRSLLSRPRSDRDSFSQVSSERSEHTFSVVLSYLAQLLFTLRQGSRVSVFAFRSADVRPGIGTGAQLDIGE